MLSINENIRIIRENIAQAAERFGKSADSVTLIGVTKTIDTDRIQEMINCGVTDIGENRVQEIIQKYHVIENQANLHMIGHLQRNKVRQIIDKVNLIHSVDNLPLAVEINKFSEKLLKTTDILIELNIAGEATKEGIEPEKLTELIKNISVLKNIKIKGIMTIAPFTENPEDIRKYFKKMYELFIDIREKSIDNVSVDVLSMGMTNDYTVAIEEGSTMVRIGTGIFGYRS